MRRDLDERAVWLVRTIVPHEPALRSWLKLRRVGDLEIDDIVQETYSKIMALDSVEAIRDPRAYAYQAAHSILVSHIRRSRIVSIHASGDIERLNLEAPEPSPERQLADRDELRELALAISAMPEKSRTVFTMRRIDGFDHEQIAARLHISRKTVEKRMTQAIRHLMDIFGRGGSKLRHTSSAVETPFRQNLGTTTHDPGD